MRLAEQRVDSAAAVKADSGIGEHLKGGVSRLSVGCTSNAARTKWVDAYVAAGGAVEMRCGCGERLAPLAADPAIAQIADRAFAARYGDRKLTLSKEDADARTAWMDLYVEYGGRVTVICDPPREKALGIESRGHSKA